MTVINEYSTLPEAYIDKGFLESHGIDAVVEQGAFSELFPAPGAGQGSITLCVPDDRAADASRLLSRRGA